MFDDMWDEIIEDLWEMRQNQDIEQGNIPSIPMPRRKERIIVDSNKIPDAEPGTEVIYDHKRYIVIDANYHDNISAGIVLERNIDDSTRLSRRMRSAPPPWYNEDEDNSSNQNVIGTVGNAQEDIEERMQERWRQMYKNSVYNSFSNSIEEYRNSKITEYFGQDNTNIQQQDIKEENKNIKTRKRQIFILDEDAQ